MSTHAVIHFMYGGESQAAIWQHWDGYPKAVLPELHEFFTTIAKQCKNDTLFDDANILAARWMVFKAFKQNEDARKRFNEKIGKMINGKAVNAKNYMKFATVFPINPLTDYGTHYIYQVDANIKTVDGFPVVSYRTAHEVSQRFPASLTEITLFNED